MDQIQKNGGCAVQILTRTIAVLDHREPRTKVHSGEKNAPDPENSMCETKLSKQINMESVSGPEKRGCDYIGQNFVSAKWSGHYKKKSTPKFMTTGGAKRWGKTPTLKTGGAKQFGKIFLNKKL